MDLSNSLIAIPGERVLILSTSPSIICVSDRFGPRATAVIAAERLERVLASALLHWVWVAALIAVPRFAVLIESLWVHSPQLAALNQLAIRSPSFPHVGADLRVRPSEEGAHTGAPLRHDPAAIVVMPGSDIPQLAAKLFNSSARHECQCLCVVSCRHKFRSG